MASKYYLSVSLDISGRVWKKEYSRNWNGFWCDVEQFASGLSPDAVKFSINKHFRPLPYRPTNYLLAAVRSDVLRKNAKAIVGWSTYEWSDWNIKRFGIFNDAAAKRNNVRLNELRRSQSGLFGDCVS
jgi:hypothetical protein